MNHREMAVLMKGIAPVFREAIISAVQPVADRLRMLELRELPEGPPGKDGRDGFTLEDFDCRVLEDDRTIEFSFKSGEYEHIATLKWPTMLYRGVYHEGTEYERGDVVTWGGSLWHCDEPTKEKPGTDSWTLAAKKGRDGKDAK
jgi:integrin beta 3